MNYLVSFFSSGFCSNPIMSDRSRRVSTSSAYLLPVLDRKNLHIAPYSHVTKVCIVHRFKNLHRMKISFFSFTLPFRNLLQDWFILYIFKVNKPDDLYNLFIIFACVEKYIFLISYNVLFIRFWFLEAI